MIKVETKSFADEDELAVAYDEESQILSATCGGPDPWVHGVDVDGTVIFDLGKDLVLRNIDLQMPKSSWDRLEFIGWPKNILKKSIVFSRESVSVKSHSASLCVKCDRDEKIVDLTFGDRMSNSQVFLLSRNCIAKVLGENLCGLMFRIDR